MRPIDADAALKALRKCQTYLYDARDPELKIELSSAEAAINNLPTIQPEPHEGHWIEKDGFDGDTYYDCSVCGNSWTTIDGTPMDNGMNYCPNCGAKMTISTK